MGLDVRIYVTGDKDISQEQVDAFNDYLKFRVPPDREYDKLTLVIPQNNYESLGIKAEWDSLMRYYGPTYTRGPWPVIYVVLKSLLDHFPDHEICYTDDCSWSDTTFGNVTEEFLEEMWDWYFSDAGDSYRRRI